MQETITETREAWIPTSMLPDFKARVTDLNKRAARLKCDPINYLITDEKDIVRIPPEDHGGYVKPGYTYEVTKVAITGTSPIIPGFQVVAKIDHDSELSTNIIMEFRDFKLPAEFRDKDGYCDHCGIKRQRNKTYVLQEEETGKLSQVGSSCLKDFTGHSNPENICHIQSFIQDSFDELSEFGSNKSDYIKVEPFLEIVAECTLRYGYVSAKKAEEQCKCSTGDEAIEIYIHSHDTDANSGFKVTPEAKELALKATEYIKTLNRDDYDSYANNIISFIENGMVKTKYFRILASSIAFYNNEQFKLNKIENSKHKTFIGEVDSKTTFDATLVGYSTAQTDFGTTHIFRFNDDNGNNITWFASSHPPIEMNEKYKITATVKSHKLYNEEPQTVITRAKCEPLKEILTKTTIDSTKKIADQIGDFLGQEVVTNYNKFYETMDNAETESHKTFIMGMENIAVYFGSSENNDGNKKNMSKMNTHQILLLANCIQSSGYTTSYVPSVTKKFFKNNKDMVAKITDMYSKKKNKGMEL